MINLLPLYIKEARLYGRRNRLLVGYSAGILLIGVMAAVVTLLNMRLVMADAKSLENELRQRQAESANLENQQKEVEKIASQLQTIDKLYTGEVKFSVLIPKIGGLLPSGVVLNTLTLTGGSTSPLQLDVQMESQELAAVFQQNLVNSDLFEAADIITITSAGDGTSITGRKNYTFNATLIASFEGAAAKKQKAAPPPAPSNTTGSEQ